VEFNFPNENGRPYKSSGGKMIKSELGEIPEGWEVGSCGDVLSLEYGKPLKEEDRIKGEFSVFGSNGVVGYHNEYLIQNGGIVVGRKGTMGSVTWVEDSFFPIDTTFYVVDKLGLEKLFFHYLLLLTQDFGKIGSDSVVPGLNRNAVYLIETLLPPTPVIEDFYVVVTDVFSKMKNNSLQIHTFSETRDVLLPKLMSGEIRVGKK